MSDPIQLIDVTPRDGLQNEARILSTDAKAALIADLVRMGARRIEAVSFAHPRLVPTMADAEAVMRAIDRPEGVSFSGLVLNARGMDRALEAGVDEVNVVVPVTDEFAEANQRTTVDGLLSALADIGRIAAESSLPLTVTLAVAFGCPFRGAVPAARTIDVARRALDSADIAELAVADTIGVAIPWQVREVFASLADAAGRVPRRAHFHATRHTALANVYAALDAGVRRFDASVAGIGGCPFAPGAAGNVATEDVAWMLEQAGLSTGIDVEEATAIGRDVCTQLDVAPRSGIAASSPFDLGYAAS